MALPMDEAVNENFRGRIPAVSAEPQKVLDAGPWGHLPPPAPLEMPVQQFSLQAERPAESRRRVYWVPRAAIFAGAAALTVAFAHELFSILAFVVITPVQFLFLILSTIAFGWIAIGSLSAALGFLPLFAGERPDTMEQPAPDAPLDSRTALLFPVYHEDPAMIAGAIEAMLNDLKALGRNRNFDVFVLSDTRGDADGGREAGVYRALSQELADTADIRQKSTPLKSNVSRSRHFRVLSPNEMSVPSERREASG